MAVFWPDIQVAHDELSLAHQAIFSDFEALNTRFEEQRQLNDRLENDLLRINESKSSHSQPRAGADGTASTPAGPREDPLSGLGVGKKAPAGQAGAEGESAAGEATAGAQQGKPSAAEASILPIITSQRDRFRQRNGELEEVRPFFSFFLSLFSRSSSA